MRDERRFRERVAHELERQKKVLERYGDAPLDAKAVADEVLAAAATLGDRIVDTLPLVERAVQTDARVLLEGQLGAMRDLDWGIYPYVTSSNPLAGGAAVGAGIPPRYITKVIGVVKAYSTAVGEGPFPTEMAGGEGDALRERANEYGATTGRPRRVGWFDAVAARHAHRLNAFTELAVTKLDVLGAYREIPFCVGYEVDGAMTTDMPPTRVLERAVPRYEKLAGWCDPLTGVADRAHLPAAAREYLKRIEATVGAPVGMVGIGPERERDAPLESAVDAQPHGRRVSLSHQEEIRRGVVRAHLPRPAGRDRAPRLHRSRDRRAPSGSLHGPAADHPSRRVSCGPGRRRRLLVARPVVDQSARRGAQPVGAGRHRVRRARCEVAAAALRR